jgi:GNAT superfamily N-acetyltransferase
MAMSLRKATAADASELAALIARSARALGTADYTPAQIEGALRGVFGVDSQLLADGTYFLVEENHHAVACGGWSFRATLFGGDARPGRDASALDPSRHPAKIRAFFVDPARARAGIGSRLLEHCERQARLSGFSRVELMATLPGVRLYEARGYERGAPIRYDLGDGESMQFIAMTKSLISA